MLGLLGSALEAGAVQYRDVVNSAAGTRSPLRRRAWRRIRGTTRTSIPLGGMKFLPRGIEKNMRCAAWDKFHNDIEVFDRRGKRLGSMHPCGGRLYKTVEKGQKLDL